MQNLKRLMSLSILALSLNVAAGVDSDFKEDPSERFSFYTGDGNYKQAYHWSLNENGEGEPITILLNHGSGGEWYDEIDSEFGPCGPDYINPNGDFTGSIYENLCNVDMQGNETFLADFNTHHVPVGPELEEFMLEKIVGSARFAAWYWQDAFSQFDSPSPDISRTIGCSRVGMMFSTDPQGQSIVTVTNVSDNTVTIDANHPLAGEDLTFDVEVTAVREATADEIDHGHAHGEGGVQH